MIGSQRSGVFLSYARKTVSNSPPPSANACSGTPPISTSSRTVGSSSRRAPHSFAPLAGHSGSVNGVAVTPDGQCALSASDDKTLKVWDLETGAEIGTLAGHSGSVNGVAVTPDGGHAVSASWDKTLKVWNLESGVALHTLAGHSNWVTSVAVTPGRAACRLRFP